MVWCGAWDWDWDWDWDQDHAWMVCGGDTKRMESGLMNKLISPLLCERG